MSAVPEVPAAYVGVWRRTLLRAPGIEDSTSQVYWLQTKSWHADLRVPAARPGCTGKKSLRDLDRGELLGLAGQQGFAGITAVDGDICRWLRQHDYQPPSGRNDIGRMVFDTPDRVFEYGVEADYFEVWERVPGSSGHARAIHPANDPALLWLEAGDCCMRVRPRRQTLAPAEDFTTLAAGLGDDALRAALDFEISFGRRLPDGRWRVALSTLPWMEGEHFPGIGP
jgi:hypothetical protein